MSIKTITKGTKLTIQMVDLAYSNSPHYLDILKEELDRLLNQRGYKILEVKVHETKT